MQRRERQVIEDSLHDIGLTSSGAEAASPVQLAHELAQRSRRRTWCVALLTSLAWVAAAASGMTLVDGHLNEGFRRQLLLNEYRFAKAHGQDVSTLSEMEKSEVQKNVADAVQMLETSRQQTLLTMQATILIATVAALLSVWLVIGSRRSTLNQINASLLSIVQHLQQPTDAPSEPAVGSNA